MNHLLTLLFTAVLLSHNLPARHFHYTPSAREAYEQVLSLRFEEAKATIAQVRRRDPDNLVVYHIENYIDFFSIYIGESEAEFQRLKANRDLRLAQIASGDPASPYYLYVQADIRLQWALARLKFGEYLHAFTEVSKAYKLLKANQEKFPEFIPNYKDLGILHAMVGTIPDGYKWGVKLLSGLEGTIEQGRKELELVLDYAGRHDFIFESEAEALYAFLLLHLENKEKNAWLAARQAGWNPASNLLHCFVQANIAMRTGRNDEAIHILEQRPRGKAYFPFPYLDFMLGIAKLRRLDPDAHIYLRRYARQFQGRNFLKEAYQKLAWHQLLLGDENGYRRYMQACTRRGYLIVGGDISAQREADAGLAPPVDLIKARLLFDGAYYKQAYRILSRRSETDFTHPRFRLEYFYRMGRIFHGMEQFPQALHYYQLTIQRGASEPYFFACNAALQAGLIYEELGMTDRAADLFRRCLAMSPEEYRTGLHQKATTGLSRLRQAARAH